ncbi:hypothetical protein BKA57DRAFT_461530 [Linnemannia elongata]|nr:hypothetical protein BKA57DRAFT_461530 [Linnemannia elongata]
MEYLLRVNIQTTIPFSLDFLAQLFMLHIILLTGVYSSSSIIPFYSCALELAVWPHSHVVLSIIKQLKETMRTLL